MITMNELVDLRMQQHIAHEIYRQQIMQRIPDPFPLLPMPIPRHIMLPPRVTLPGVDATLQNIDLWKQFHQIGTEMIITKSGRRMFPSMRLSLSGLEDDVNYCVLLEMVPIGDCRFKFSGSQWVPAGGAEPQSPQRMYLHPDSPATGSHWQAQPILFNKVKLTNNTLDSNGHVVLTSMHKYQPRIHIIRTSDPTQIPWAPQQPFVFPETEFVAVTAYQNDRITKLKIDNNPFAKGFRETGQSRCKRKMASSPSLDNHNQQQQQQQQQHQQQQQSSLTTLSSSSSSSASEISPIKSNNDHFINDHENRSDDNDSPLIKRMRSNSSACSTSSSLDDRDERTQSFSSLISCSGSSGTSSPSIIPNPAENFRGNYTIHQQQQQQQQNHQNLLNHQHQLQHQQNNHHFHHHNPHSHHHHHHHQSIRNNELLMQHLQKNMQNLINPSLMDLACSYFGRNPTAVTPAGLGYSQTGITSSSLPIAVTIGNQRNNNNLTSQFYSSAIAPSLSSSPSSTSSFVASSSSTSSMSLATTIEQNLPGYYSPPINVDIENHDDLNIHNDDNDDEHDNNHLNHNLLNGNSPAPADIAPSVIDIVNNSTSPRTTTAAVTPTKSILITGSPSSTSSLVIQNNNNNGNNDKLNSDEIVSDDDLIVKLPSKRNNFTISAILGGDN